MLKDNEQLSGTFWEVELRKLNDSLPKARKSVLELLKDERPSYTNLGGEVIFMDRDEIKEIAKLMDEGNLGKVQLPFLIFKEAGSKKGEFLIQGNEIEIQTINAILKRSPDNRILYRPEILDLLKKFPSLVIFGYQFSNRL